MSRLIALRQRIKTAITIQKTTHAMRLTSMSAHARLQRKKHFLKNYKQTLEELMHRLGLEETLESPIDQRARHLIIVVGSQKGLCGAFNSRLMQLYEEQHSKSLQPLRGHLVCIGKKVVDYFEQRGVLPRHSYATFGANNFVAIAHELERIIFSEQGYDRITVYSNYPHTFFVQKSTTTTIIRRALTIAHDTELPDPYEYDEHPTIFHEKLQRLYFKACLEEVLFNSLIAEQASRFIAMDMATRNADTMLNDMQRDYNKLRQASITRELTDLAGGML